MLEIELPKLIPEFALVVRPDATMGDAEAYTEFAPPQIVVRESTYCAALNRNGRARMTLAHELGHLLMHAHDRRLHRMASGNRPAPTSKKYETAEWQAKMFGALFLMPEHIVSDCKTAADIAERCVVSAQAAEIRIAQLASRTGARQLPPEVKEIQDRFRG